MAALFDGGERGVRGRIHHHGEQVVCVGARHGLRAGRHPDGGLVVESMARAVGRWDRVDEDLVTLTRATVRVRLAAPDLFPALVGEVWRLGSVEGLSSDAPGDVSRDPVGALIRATYPLLRVRDAGEMPAIPAAIPPHLQPAFRRTSARAAARLLFGERTTRPVVRAFASSLLRCRPPDLFAVTVAMAAARTLQPDHLARVLAAPSRTDGLAPLAPMEIGTLASVLVPASPRRQVRLLEAALGSPADRQRLRFIAQVYRPGAPRLDEAEDLTALALAAAVAPAPGGGVRVGSDADGPVGAPA
jgi:hypothetical protein